MSTITRRAILAGAASASIAAIPIAATAATHDTDAALAAWRSWWTNTIQWHRLQAESQRIWATLPEEVRLSETETQAEVQSGYRAIVDQMTAVHLRAWEADAALEAITATTPVAIAARCHFALDGLAQNMPGAYIDSSPQTRGLAFLIRDLLPQLPTEMAAAMAPLADGWRPLKDMWDATS